VRFLTLCPYITTTENNRKNLSPERIAAVKILPRTAQYACSTGLSPRKHHEESKAWHCWCEIWHYLLETRLIRHINRHLVTQFTVANSKKQNFQVCRTICDSFHTITFNHI
jgi:hypothetical protein